VFASTVLPALADVNAATIGGRCFIESPSRRRGYFTFAALSAGIPLARASGQFPLST